MLKRILIGASVILLMVAVLFFRGDERPTHEGTPIDSVTRMIDAARDGAADAYLDCFTGALRDDLTAMRAAKSPAMFDSAIQSSVEGITGLAVKDEFTLDDGRVRLRIERVFAEHNELGEIVLHNTDTGWKIEQVTGAQRFIPEIRYGTPVER